jgi:hypothetical protein
VLLAYLERLPELLAILALLFFVIFNCIKLACMSERSPVQAPKRRLVYKALEVAVVILLGVVLPLLLSL